MSSTFPGTCRRLTNASCRLVSAGVPLWHAQRSVGVGGGGRGDLFTRHVGQYKAPQHGYAIGIRDVSESTEPQGGQLHIRKRHDHLQGERKYSGGGHLRPAIASWSYLIPSLRTNVEAAIPVALYEKLSQTNAFSLTLAEQQQLAEAQHLLRFELQQRIGLLEDSLAEAALPYLLQWPSIFQRVWVRVPLAAKPLSNEEIAHALPSPKTVSFTSLASCEPTSALTSTAATTGLTPLSMDAWALQTLTPLPALKRSAALKEKKKSSNGNAFLPRLESLTEHVVQCVEEDLQRLKANEGSPKSRRQGALEATWKAQWQASKDWHSSVSR